MTETKKVSSTTTKKTGKGTEFTPESESLSVFQEGAEIVRVKFDPRRDTSRKTVEILNYATNPYVNKNGEQPWVDVTLAEKLIVTSSVPMIIGQKNGKDVIGYKTMDSSKDVLDMAGNIMENVIRVPSDDFIEKILPSGETLQSAEITLVDGKEYLTVGCFDINPQQTMESTFEEIEKLDANGNVQYNSVGDVIMERVLMPSLSPFQILGLPIQRSIASKMMSIKGKQEFNARKTSLRPLID
jgi:hypothetical protein